MCDNNALTFTPGPMQRVQYVDPGPAINNIIWYILPESTLHELKFCLEIALASI